MLTIKNIIIALVVFASINACSSQNSEKQNSNLEPNDFNHAINKGGIVIDVRTAEEYASGYITKAISIDYLNNNFVDRINELNKEEVIYLYCASGNRSSKAQKKLADLGFQKVYNLKGGLLAWKKAELPIQK